MEGHVDMAPDYRSPDGTIELYCGDCLEILPTLSNVDAVVTDPPYGVDLTARVTKHTKRSASVSYLDDDASFEEVLERVKLAISICKTAAITPGNRRMHAYPKPADIGCVFFPNGAGCGSFGFTLFNPVLYYGKNITQFRVPSSVSATHWFSEDVDHPCPKPLQWMLWMVRKATDAGHVVADPFMGSGTTGVACVRLGRRFIGIEIERRYFDIAVKRIEAEIDRTAMFEPPPVERQQELFVEATA